MSQKGLKIFLYIKKTLALLRQSSAQVARMTKKIARMTRNVAGLAPIFCSKQTAVSLIFQKLGIKPNVFRAFNPQFHGFVIRSKQKARSMNGLKVFCCAGHVSGESISFLSSRTVDWGSPVLRATFSTESPSKRKFFATSLAFFRAAPYSQYDLSMSFIMLLSIYLALKLHNFTSFCNTLNTGSLANSL